MNQRQAKKMALEIAVSIIYANSVNGSDLILGTIVAHGGNEEDIPKVAKELEEIGRQLQVKYERFS